MSPRGASHGLQERPEPPGIKDAQSLDIAHREQVTVPGDEYVSSSSKGRGQHPGIVGVSHHNLRRCVRLGHSLEALQEREDLSGGGWRHAKPGPQYALQFLEDDLGRKQFMLGEDEAEEISA